MNNITAANFPDKEWCSLLWPLPAHRQKFLAATKEQLASAEANRFYEQLARRMTLIPPDAVSRLAELVDNASCISESIDRSGALRESEPALPLSIVTISRNDTHVERMEERTQAFIDSFLYQAESYKRPIELIIVEWNPPSDRPSMAEAFQFPLAHPYASVKIVSVPNSLHAGFHYASRLPLYQMIGKNVGIRRARGAMILATNIDVLLSDELFETITSGTLEAGCHYRSDRWDTDRSILDIQSPAKRLEQARDLCLGVNTRRGLMPRHTVSTEKEEHTSRSETPYVPHLHTMACGDFQLLHREDWALLRGYPEFDAYSMHLDTMFAMQCHAFGLVENTFASAMPHYHIDHTLGVQVKAAVYFTQEKQEIRHVSLGGIVAMTEAMLTSGEQLHINSESWGLAGIDLQENYVTAAHWDKQPRARSLTSSDAGQATSSSLISLSAFESWAAETMLPAVDASMRYVAETAIRLADGRKIMIWGRGIRGSAICAYFSEMNHPVDGFIDGTLASNTTDTFQGYPVHPADKYCLPPEPEERRPFVIIASSYVSAIEPTLTKAGYIEGRDYLLGV